MNKLLLLTGGALLCAASAFSAPCMPASLATYIAMGSSGCVLGNLVVANFGYQAKSSGGAGEITADQVNVTPLLAPTGTFGLEFSAPWAVQTGQSQMSGITYHVLSSSASRQIEQVRLDGAGFRAGMFGSVTVVETLATLAATASLQIDLKCDETCQSQTSAMATLNPPASTLFVSDQATLESKQGPAALANFADWFVVCAACV